MRSARHSVTLCSAESIAPSPEKLMRSVCAIATLIFLSACASQPEATATTACAEPRPLVCTMEYLPTCAVLVAGGTKEFASPCTACSDEAVTGYVTGPCPE